MATFVKSTQRLKPFRQHAETDVINLFTLQDDDGDIVASYADLKAEGAKMTKGILVSVKGNGWKNTDDPVNKTGIGTPGASYTNTTSFRYGATAAVEPYKAGAEIALANGENVEPLGLIEVARETGAYMGLVSGELQRGAIPHTVYGDLQFQLSGFAINTLRQGIDSVLRPRITAMEDAYTQISHLLCDQYSSGMYDPISVSGRARNRTFFSEAVPPESIAEAGMAEIKIVSQLPEDDMSRMSMAQMARDGQTPLLSDNYVRDKILGLQDADSIEDAIKEQLAERTLPEAALWALLQSTEERGRPDLSQFYYGELMHILMQKQMMRQQSMMPQQPQGGQGGPPTADPRVMPNAMAGAPPPTPNMQGGPNMPPGSPRPGAQQNGAGSRDRLRDIGLIGANELWEYKYFIQIQVAIL